VANHTGAHRTQVIDRPANGTGKTLARQRLVAAHQAAIRFFTDHLAATTGASPREYLHSRGFGRLLGSTRWELGYAPPSWTALTDHLHASGFDTDELLTAGLVVRSRTGGVVDRFRDRVMLPIHDLGGDPVGFVGRAAPGADSDTPKYLNSPRTPLFDKGATLFGLSEQQDVLSSGAVPVIVEGPFDVLAVSLAGSEQAPALAAVAPCGTSLTAGQVSALVQFSQHRLLVAFDADAAGNRAGAAAYNLLATQFANLRAAELPEGFDPAGLLEAAGPPALQQRLSQDRPLADVVLDQGLRYWLDRRENAEARAAAVHELAPTIARLRPDDVARQAGRLAQAMDIDHSVITQVTADAVTKDAEARSTGRSRGRFSTAPFPRQRPAPSFGLL
jgi:DNA primase